MPLDADEVSQGDDRHSGVRDMIQRPEYTVSTAVLLGGPKYSNMPKDEGGGSLEGAIVRQGPDDEDGGVR